ALGAAKAAADAFVGARGLFSFEKFFAALRALGVGERRARVAGVLIFAETARREISVGAGAAADERAEALRPAAEPAHRERVRRDPQAQRGACEAGDEMHRHAAEQAATLERKFSREQKNHRREHG